MPLRLGLYPRDEKQARDFRVKCAQLGFSQSEVMQAMVDEFLDNSKHAEVIVKRVLKAAKK